MKFSNLQLQDLTHGNIANYIESTVGSYPHIEDLAASNFASAVFIINELIIKTTAIFLEVVLGCQPVIIGFVAYNSIQGLKQQVIELLLELEDLVKHILDSVEQRYYGQIAEILKIGHQRQVIPSMGTRR